MANSKRRCTHCKEYAVAKDGFKFPAGFFCSIKHAKEYGKAKQDKANAKQASKAKKVQAESKKANSKALKDYNRKDIRWQHKQTQPRFNKMRVLQEIAWFEDRGLAPVCISCGKPGMDWCAGHFKTRGSQGNLRYDASNVFLQCNRYCNMGLSGNIEGNKTTRGYKQGLLDRFGEERGREIIDYCESNNDTIRWDWEVLEKMRAGFNARIRELS